MYSNTLTGVVPSLVRFTFAFCKNVCCWKLLVKLVFVYSEGKIDHKEDSCKSYEPLSRCVTDAIFNVRHFPKFLPANSGFFSMI